MTMLATVGETNITIKSRAPETMKAAVIRQFGDVDVLQYEDIETPRPNPGNILIKVLAAGVNRLDHYIREGSIEPELPFPHILGADAVGEVVDVGDGVTDVRIGERVIPAPGFSLKEEEDDIRPLVTAPSFVLATFNRAIIIATSCASIFTSKYADHNLAMLLWFSTLSP